MKLPNVSSQYGAPLGRREFRGETTERLHLARVRLFGDYDSGGAYWGQGRPLYRVWSDDGAVSLYLRADSRDDAKQAVTPTLRSPRWYR